MIRYGKPPYLECSSKGDKRFSAFHAMIGAYSIEDIYQNSKILSRADKAYEGRHAKGRKAKNASACARLYSALWDFYIRSHPELKKVLRDASGLSDIFGQEGHCCQATELWRIKQELKA